MWSFILTLSGQIRKYGTFLGQIWYIFVFVFRLIVYISVGNAVYRNERDHFICDDATTGCTNSCYDKFSAISSLRFWAFQLMAVTTPAIVFHLYATHSHATSVSRGWKPHRADADSSSSLNTWARKLPADDEEGMRLLKDTSETVVRHFASRHHSPSTSTFLKNIAPGTKRERKMRKHRRRYSRISEEEQFKREARIRRLYYLCCVARIFLEGLFIYLSYTAVFLPMINHCQMCICPYCVGVGECSKDSCGQNIMDFAFVFRYMWTHTPPTYLCSSDGPESDVNRLCSPHLQLEQDGHISCYVSRAFEKTLFTRYMSIMSAVCLLVLLLELVQLTFLDFWKKFAECWNNINSKGPEDLLPPSQRRRIRSRPRSKPSTTATEPLSVSQIKFGRVKRLPTPPKKKTPYNAEKQDRPYITKVNHWVTKEKKVNKSVDEEDEDKFPFTKLENKLSATSHKTAP